MLFVKQFTVILLIAAHWGLLFFDVTFAVVCDDGLRIGWLFLNACSSIDRGDRQDKLHLFSWRLVNPLLRKFTRVLVLS